MDSIRKNIKSGMFEMALTGVLQETGSELDDEMVRAIQHNDIDATEACINSGANIRIMDDFALMTGTLRGNVRLVKLLLSKSVPPTANQNKGFWHASMLGHHDVLNALFAALDAKSDQDGALNTCLLAAIEGQQVKILDDLVDRGLPFDHGEIVLACKKSPVIKAWFESHQLNQVAGRSDETVSDFQCAASVRRRSVF